MLFLDNAALDSCCAECPLHIPTYPRLVSTAATVREKTWEQRHRDTDRPTDRPTDHNNPSLRMHARGLITRRMLSIVGERELRLHSESHVLRCTVNDLC